MISLTIVKIIFTINEINRNIVIKIIVLIGIYISNKILMQITCLCKRLFRAQRLIKLCKELCLTEQAYAVIRDILVSI